MKVASKPTGALAAGLLCGLVVSTLSLEAEAVPPPLRFVYAAVGEQAEARREADWTLTLVDDGVVTMRLVERSARAMRFESGDNALEVGAESDSPFELVWAVLWSTTPGDALADYRFAASTARVEVVGGELAFCYGEGDTLCVDAELRRVLLLSVGVDGARVEVRVQQGGSAAQVSRDGRLVARLRAR